MECSTAGVHAPLRAGIHGNAENGAYSVVLYVPSKRFFQADILPHASATVLDPMAIKMTRIMAKRGTDVP